MSGEGTGSGQGGGRAPLLDAEAILRILPHRPPFLLIDRVVEHQKGKRLVAWKSVSMGEPFFAGHFPGHPVMPGVLVLEAMAQASALLVILDLPPEEVERKVTYLMGIDGARFRRRVVPGDRLELEVEVVRSKGAVWKTKGTARVDGQVAAEAEYLAMLALPEQKA
jgi:3-hydroxyacyl-[acyl-carrier-protein] dehydratase